MNSEHPETWLAGGVTYPLCWSVTDGEVTVSCRPREADGPLYGFGPSWQDALRDLEREYARLQELIND